MVVGWFVVVGGVVVEVEVVVAGTVPTAVWLLELAGPVSEKDPGVGMVLALSAAVWLLGWSWVSVAVWLLDRVRGDGVSTTGGSWLGSSSA